MDKTDKIWKDGELIPWDECMIHGLTHTFHYGLGVFEGIRFYQTPLGPAIFRLKDHVDRLFRGAELASMKVQYSKKNIEDAIIDTIKVNQVTQGYIRPIIFYGYGKMGLNPMDSPVYCIIAVWPWGKYLGKDIVKIKTSSFIRLHPKSTHSEAKITGHYFNSIFAGMEAKKAGFDEALLLDFKGNIAEGPGENIFFVKDKVLYTPEKGSILPGITRDSIIKIAKDLNIIVKEKKITPTWIRSCEESFFTGTAAEVTAIGQIDNTIISKSTGPITEKIKSTYDKAIHGKESVYSNWLTHVNQL